MLHRTRHLFIRQQTAVINAIRAHLAEFGIVAPVGRNGVEQLLEVVADSGDKRLPEVVRACIAALGAQLRMLKGQILEFDRLIMAWHRSNETSKRLDDIPGVGPAPGCYQPAGMASTIADAHAFATADRYFSFTLATQPALVTKSSRLQELSAFKSTSCSGCCSAFITQAGVSARTVASWALVVAILPAVPPVTQPPQVKPIIIAATAPPIAPHIAGFIAAGTCIVKLPFKF
jgi:hypothetical protein